MVMPDSPSNIEVKAKADLAQQLKIQVKNNFKQYYEEVKIK